MERKYLPTISELIDRLSILQLKEVFIPEHKEQYAQEIQDIMHDIEAILAEIDLESTEWNKDTFHPSLIASLIRFTIVLAQMNLHIWHNEAEVRKGTGDGDLALTHGLNGIRNTAKNKIQDIFGGRGDYKIDCLAADFKDWEISW